MPSTAGITLDSDHRAGGLRWRWDHRRATVAGGVPMPLPELFQRESLYLEEAWFLDDVLELDKDAGRIVASLETERLDGLVHAQRPWDGRHAQHLPGAVAVQMTGTLGNLHAVMIMGLLPSEGWVGYGTGIKRARFPSVGVIGPPVIATAQALRCRQVRGTWFLEYDFEFSQEERSVYESQQTAAWFQP